ncbi:hypothetical protein HDU93_007553 [Gonapodya sp. JEL0774]|nr:hypothetical protein HDU93_007553 [Gonapodya sp. JEL0774]
MSTNRDNTRRSINWVDIAFSDPCSDPPRALVAARSFCWDESPKDIRDTPDELEHHVDQDDKSFGSTAGGNDASLCVSDASVPAPRVFNEKIAPRPEALDVPASAPRWIKEQSAGYPRQAIRRTDRMVLTFADPREEVSRTAAEIVAGAEGLVDAMIKVLQRIQSGAGTGWLDWDVGELVKKVGEMWQRDARQRTAGAVDRVDETTEALLMDLALARQLSLPPDVAHNSSPSLTALCDVGVIDAGAVLTRLSDISKPHPDGTAAVSLKGPRGPKRVEAEDFGSVILFWVRAALRQRGVPAVARDDALQQTVTNLFELIYDREAGEEAKFAAGRQRKSRQPLRCYLETMGFVELRAAKVDIDGWGQR